MKILFLYPIPLNYSFLKYNHGISSLSAVLKKKGCQVSLLGGTKLNQFDLIKKVNLVEPNLFAISLTSNKRQTGLDICNFLKPYINGRPLIIGGVHATVAPQDALSFPGVTGVCQGDGELPLCRLIDYFKTEESDFSSIPNFWWKNGKNIVAPKHRWYFNSVYSFLPYDLEIFNLKNELQKTKRLSFMASRGCKFRCSYCINSTIFSKHIFFSPIDVIEQIKETIFRAGIPNHISFHDDNFPTDIDWLLSFSDLYKNFIKIPFYCQISVQNIKRNVLKLLKKAGCFEIRIGIENGSEALRRKVLNKNIGNDFIVSKIKLLKEFKIRVVTLCMIGVPYENHDTVNETFKFIRKIRPDAARMAIFQPYPGSKLHNICLKNKWINPVNFADSLYELSENKIPYLNKKELLKYYQKFHSEFNISAEA